MLGFHREVRPKHLGLRDLKTSFLIGTIKNLFIVFRQNNLMYTPVHA